MMMTMTMIIMMMMMMMMDAAAPFCRHVTHLRAPKQVPHAPFCRHRAHPRVPVRVCCASIEHASAYHAGVLRTFLQAWDAHIEPSEPS